MFNRRYEQSIFQASLFLVSTFWFIFALPLYASETPSKNVDSVKDSESKSDQPLLSSGISSASEEDAQDLNPGILAESESKVVSASASYPMYLNSLNLESRFAMPVIKNRLGIGIGANYSPQSSVGGMELGMGGGIKDLFVGGFNVVTERTLLETETRANAGLKVGGYTGIAGAFKVTDVFSSFREFSLGVSYKTKFGLVGGVDLTYPSFSRTISLQPVATYNFSRLLCISAGYWMPVRSLSRGSAFLALASRPVDWLGIKTAFDARFTELSFSVIGFF